MLVSSLLSCRLLPRCRADFWLFLLPFVLVQSIGSGLYIANLSLRPGLNSKKALNLRALGLPTAALCSPLFPEPRSSQSKSRKQPQQAIAYPSALEPSFCLWLQDR